MMTRSVLEWLEKTAARREDRPAFTDGKETLTYGGLLDRAREVGSFLAERMPPGDPVLLLADKTPSAVAAMLGIVYAGAFYTPVDASMPEERLRLITRQLAPAGILCEKQYLELARRLSGTVWCLEEIAGKADAALLRERVEGQVDTDLLYVLFTSGSTGIPKGVAVTHRSVIDFTEWACGALRYDESCIFGNQAPLYFDNSVMDLYCAIRTGAEVVFLPKVDFAFPRRMLDDLARFGVNTVFWVPSALTSLAASGLLQENPPALKNIFFCGEVMPCRTLNTWRAALPDARYVNMYGPTEITDVCTWYEVNRKFSDDDVLPIGRPCANARVELINGEICVSGTCLAAGYYNDPEKTAEAFRVLPGRSWSLERVYHTGDLGTYNELGEMMFQGRMDSQIKRNGCRIELGEIECVLLSIPEIKEGCAVYLPEKEKIICVYLGNLSEKELRAAFRSKLPRYMIPDLFYCLEELPRTGSGKLDRRAVRQVVEHVGSVR